MEITSKSYLSLYIDIHAMNIFNYEKIDEEMAELLKDFKSSGKGMDDKF